MTVGRYLQEAREASGYSIADISTRTRIPASVIKDLEAENFLSSGGTAYARGHIRTIAKIIDADIDRLLVAFDESTVVAERPMIELLEENSATVLRNRNASQITISPKMIGIAASVIAGIAIIIPSGLALSSSITKKSAPTKSPSITRSASNKSASGSTSSNKQVVKNPVAPSQSAVVAGHQVVLTAANGTSWVYVSDGSGVQLFSGKLSNGATQTFDPTNGLYMKIGNSGAVSVSVDGKDQGILGAQGEVKSLTFAAAATNG